MHFLFYLERTICLVSIWKCFSYPLVLCILHQPSPGLIKVSSDEGLQLLFLVLASPDSGASLYMWFDDQVTACSTVKCL